MTTGLAAQPTGIRGLDPAELAKRISSAGVPRRFEDCRLETFVAVKGTQHALEAATALGRDQDGRGLVLTGPAGTGKTHLAVAILRARLEAWLAEYPDAVHEVRNPGGRYEGATQVFVRPNLAVRFLVVPSFLDRLRASARYVQAEDPLPELFADDLVVLDDLGREKATDWATERLYVLVNERYNRCLPTVVTSNYSPDELLERGYDALVSRLTDGAELLWIDAPDYRRRGR